MEFYSKKVLLHLQFTFTALEIFLFEGRSVTCPAQQVTQPERVKISVRNKINSVFIEFTEKMVVVLSQKVWNGFY